MVFGRQTQSLVYAVKADVRDFRTGMKQVRGDLDKTDSSAGTAAGGFGKMNKAMGVFLASAAVAEMGRFAFDIAKMGQNAKIAGDAAEKVLGPALEGLQDRLDDVRRSAGLSVGEFDGLLAQMGLMTENLNLSDPAQAGYIERMIEMAAALAEFNPHGGDTADALEAIFSGLKNNFNPLEQFGLKLKKADINERAEELQDLDSALSDTQAEFDAFVDLLEERGMPAMEEWDRSINTVTEEANEASSQWKSFKETLGQIVAPAVSFVIGLITMLFDGLFALRAFLGGGGWKAAWAKFIEPPTRMLRDLSDAWGRFMGRISSVKSALRGIRFPALPSWMRSGFRFPSFAKGGTVPGPRGQPTPIMAHGGERITSLANSNGGGDGIHLTVNVGVGDGHAIGREIVQYLEIYQRGSGAIPIDVSGAR